MLDARLLSDHFGIGVHDVDLRKPLSDELLVELLSLLCEHRVLAVRGQRLEATEFAAYCRELGGQSIRHVLTRERAPAIPEVPDILPLSNKYAATGATNWHTDQSYEAVRATVTILYCLKAPQDGGETRFIDMVAAYRALPEAMRQQVDPLVLTHSWGHGIAVGEDELPPPSSMREPEPSAMGPAQADAHPIVEHPLVLRHPVTGVKALYSPWGTARGIVGWPLERARELLVSLRDHCLQPQFRYHHRYQVGDVVAWDTSATMHAAMPLARSTGPHDQRLLWRISMSGPPRLGPAVRAAGAGPVRGAQPTPDAP